MCNEHQADFNADFDNAQQELAEYLDEIMQVAALAPSDARRVRNELADHLEELLKVRMKNGMSEMEVMAMMKREFGEPQVLGAEIAKARGRFRTYLKKEVRKLPVSIGVAVVLAFILKSWIVQSVWAATDALSPAIPKGSRCLVYKLQSHYMPGDVVCFEGANRELKLGTFKSADEAQSRVVIVRYGRHEITVDRSALIGRVILNTR